MGKRQNEIAYDRAPVQLKVLPGVSDQLKAIDGWQARIRAAIDALIQEDESKKA